MDHDERDRRDSPPEEDVSPASDDPARPDPIEEPAPDATEPAGGIDEAASERSWDVPPITRARRRRARRAAHGVDGHGRDRELAEPGRIGDLGGRGTGVARVADRATRRRLGRRGYVAHGTAGARRRADPRAGLDDV